MKASELIIALAQAIKDHGDCLVLMGSKDGMVFPDSLIASVEPCANSGHLVAIRRSLCV